MLTRFGAIRVVVFPKNWEQVNPKKQGNGIFVPKETFGDRLKMLRGDIPQADFGKVYGLSKNTLSSYENESSAPKVSFLAKLASDFGVSVDWILFGDDGPPKPALTARENSLLANYRASPEEGKRSLETTSALLAKSQAKKVKKAE